MGDLRSRAESGDQPAVDGYLPPGPDPQWTPPTPEENGRAMAEALAESPVPAEMDVPVHIAWSRVMGDVQWLGKDRRTTSGSQYNYRGIDDVMNLVAPVLRKHGVAVIPVGAAPSYETIVTKSGSAMNYCRIVSRFQVFGPRGDSFVGETPGEAFDSGDKSSSKAQSVALRTFYIQGLSLATNRPQLDPEYGEQHEIAGPQRPTAYEYMAMILDERTSLGKLDMIKAELYGDRTTATTEVELADGTRIRLVDLVLKVGRERKRS